jgi:hypothetical protein
LPDLDELLVNRAAGLKRVWQEAMRALQMDLHVRDPTVGPVVE